ncbi:MAG: flagellar hook-length control protein FliK [Lachnospiraceae bacterium]|nr:flagellar hook-length control protein FliK [Lachnospiraceae bacterium]
MTSAPVRDVMYGMESVSHANTAKKTETAQEKEHDFRMIMNQAKNQAKQTVHQPNEEKVEKKDISQSKDTYKAEDEYETKETPKKEDFRSEEAGKNKSDKLNNVSEAEPIDEEVETAVEGIVKEVMQEIEEMLEVSEEELVDVLEQLGLQPIDLLNPDNMASIMTALTGEDSTIQLVMDEEMYLTLQDLMQMVEDKTQELMSATGLSDEELEAVMDQLKLLTNQQLSHEEMEMKQVQILPFESEEEVVAEDGDVSVIVKNENDLQDVQTTEVTQDSPERTVEKTETGKSEDSLFQEQQQNMQSFQNMSDEISQLAGESKLEGTGTPNTESILKQLADYVKIQKGKELTEMELQLHPASLGNVKVTLATKGGVVTAQLTTENEIVKNAIESQVSQLKQNLEEQGVRVEAIEVSVASHQMERNLEQNAKDGEQEQKQETGGIHKIRKTSINLNSFEDADELLEEMTGADDATRIAMEMMAMGGNRMDLLA